MRFPRSTPHSDSWDFETAETWRIAVEAAPSLGLALAGAALRERPYDYERGLQQVAPEFSNALFMPNSAVFVRDAARIAEFALRHGIVYA